MRASRGSGFVALLTVGIVLGDLGAPAPALAQAVPPAAAAALDLEDLDEAPPAPNPALAWGTVGAIYVGLWGWTTAAWYARRAEGDFAFADEGFFSANTYAGGADKAGHLWSNYALTRGVTGILEHGGVRRGRALVVSTALATGFFTFSEIKDGYHEGFGFSWQDVVMNSLGQGLAALMIYSPSLDEAIDFRVQYFPSADFVRKVKEDGPFNAPEDYTGQTYLVAYHLGSLDAVKTSERWGWLSYVDVNLGFAARDYLPVPDDGRMPRQHLFLGVGLNLQAVVDRTMVPRPTRARHEWSRDARKATGRGTQALGFVTEVYAPPLTTLELGALDRAGVRREEGL